MRVVVSFNFLKKFYASDQFRFVFCVGFAQCRLSVCFFFVILLGCMLVFFKSCTVYQE